MDRGGRRPPPLPHALPLPPSGPSDLVLGAPEVSSELANHRQGSRKGTDVTESLLQRYKGSRLSDPPASQWFSDVQDLEQDPDICKVSAEVHCPAQEGQSLETSLSQQLVCSSQPRADGVVGVQQRA